MALERIQKILAQTGVASRRNAEKLILEGSVTVNGKPVKLGDKAEWGKDAIKVHGKLLRFKADPIYLAFYKPKNVISMLADAEGRPTLKLYFSKLKERVFPIGRLDFTSEGLLLLTNDGDFAEKIQKNEKILKIYSVKVKGHPDSEMLSRLQRASSYDDPSKKRIRPYSVRLLEKSISKSFVEVAVQCNRAFDIQAYFKNRGFLVERIIRTAFGHISLKDMVPGNIRVLKPTQITALVEQPELGIERHEKEMKDSHKKSQTSEIIRPTSHKKKEQKF